MSRSVGLYSAAIASIIALAVALLALVLGGAWWFVLLLAAAAVGVAVSAYQHSNHPISSWLTLLWVSSLVLLVSTVLSIASVGLLLLPAILLALIAHIAGRRQARTDSTARS